MRDRAEEVAASGERQEDAFLLEAARRLGRVERESSRVEKDEVRLHLVRVDR